MYTHNRRNSLNHNSTFFSVFSFLFFSLLQLPSGRRHCSLLIVIVFIVNCISLLCVYNSSINLFGKGYRGPAPFHRLTLNKRFEPVFSTVIMAVCSPFNRMLLLTDLIPVHLLYCEQTVMIGCNHTSFEWTRAVRHIYGMIRHVWCGSLQQLGRYYNPKWKF